METFEKFVGLYSLSKTLRFELKPIGKTLQLILDKGILEQDKHRADSYVLVKKIIDEYHKDFIEAVFVDDKNKIRFILIGKFSLQKSHPTYSLIKKIIRKNCELYNYMLLLSCQKATI